MFTKVSRPTIEAVIQTDHSKKSYGTPRLETTVAGSRRKARSPK